MLLCVRFKPLAFLLSLALLTGGKSATAAEAAIEELLAAENTAAGIRITVETGGCTKKSDFEVNSSPVRNNQASIEFRRLNEDTCKGNFPAGIKLDFTWADLKLPQGTKLSIKNPVEHPASIESPVKKTDGINPQTRNMRSASAGQKGKSMSKPVRHRHVQRQAHAHAKVHARVRKRTHVRVHAAPRGAQFCHKFPLSRQCRHRMHTRIHRRHHYRHRDFCPFGDFF